MGGVTTNGAVAKAYSVAGLNQNDVDGSGGLETTVIFAAGADTATAADLLTLADLNAAAGTLSNGAANDEFIFNASSGDAAIYYFKDDANNPLIESGELQLLGMSDAAIAATDIAFNA